MAYENISVGSLKSSLNACKNSINYNITNDYSNSILQSSIWINYSKKQLHSAFNSLKSVYEELESTIDNYLGVADMIEEYKEYQTKNSKLEADNSELRKKQYYEESEEYVDKNGKVKERTWEVEDKAVTAQINANNAEIARNLLKMESLESRISSSL